jgi:hypothetical protein
MTTVIIAVSLMGTASGRIHPFFDDFTDEKKIDRSRLQCYNSIVIQSNPITEEIFNENF